MASQAEPLKLRTPAPGRGRALFWAVAVVAAVGASLGAGRLGRERAEDVLAQRAAEAEPLATASLAAVIEKMRLIPMVFARDPEVIALLAAPNDRARDQFNAKLADIAKEADAAVIYVVGRDGIAVAASNARSPDSFVGSDYGFRTYFTRAMETGEARQYALGTVSRRPGLYLSRRVEGAAPPGAEGAGGPPGTEAAGRPHGAETAGGPPGAEGAAAPPGTEAAAGEALGVVVVKVEFDALEARWRDSGLTVLVTDADGVALVTTDPAWRFAATRPVADEAALRAALQLDAPALPRAPLVEQGPGWATLAGALQATASGPVGPAAPGWTLTVFQPAEPMRARAARSAAATAFLAVLGLAAAAAAALRRRRSRLARQAELAALNLELERRVAERTEALNRSNRALGAEMAEREAMETRVRRLRDDLAQANRLSILGQVTAGVAHEINQPVAAIRAYADTGRRLIDAGLVADARENFGEIVGVTERIGAITQGLRGFSRRAKGETRPIVVAEALDGALTLLAGRIREAGVEIRRGPVPAGLRVRAGRIRFEQIIVNLLQNALDAVAGRPEPRIAIRVAAGPESVAVTVADNGPGVSAEMQEHLFMPFNTTKEKGLGLGLLISADIAREFGGALRLEPGGPGAAFTLELPRADAPGPDLPQPGPLGRDLPGPDLPKADLPGPNLPQPGPPQPDPPKADAPGAGPRGAGA